MLRKSHWYIYKNVQEAIDSNDFIAAHAMFQNGVPFNWILKEPRQEYQNLKGHARTEWQLAELMDNLLQNGVDVQQIIYMIKLSLDYYKWDPSDPNYHFVWIVEVEKFDNNFYDNYSLQSMISSMNSTIDRVNDIIKNWKNELNENKYDAAIGYAFDNPPSFYITNIDNNEYKITVEALKTNKDEPIAYADFNVDGDDLIMFLYYVFERNYRISTLNGIVTYYSRFDYVKNTDYINFDYKWQS